MPHQGAVVEVRHDEALKMVIRPSWSRCRARRCSTLSWHAALRHNSFICLLKSRSRSRCTPRSFTLSSVVMIVLPTVSVVLESLGSFRIIAWNLPGLACIMLASNHFMAVVDSAMSVSITCCFESQQADTVLSSA